MSYQPSTTEKGATFERRLARLFESRGYQVQHDVRLRGRSGVEHQIDVLAFHNAPLHTSKIIVEAKSYQGSVDKDRVMKLIQIVNDLGADRGILATTSDFTPDAIKTAAGHNVEIWNRDHIAKLLGELEVAAVEGSVDYGGPVLSRAVRARLDSASLTEQLARAVEKRGKGVLGIGKVREELAEVRSIAYPYYDVEVGVHVTETQRVGLIRKETISKTLGTFISFDAHTGMLVHATTNSIHYPYVWLAQLERDEIAVLRAVGANNFDRAGIATLGMSEARARKTISLLMGRGLLRQTSTRPANYQAVNALPPQPHELAAISEVFPVEEDADSSFVPFGSAMKEPAAIAHAVESYWLGASVRAMSVVYYPYYFALYRRIDGSIRVDVIDAVSGVEHDVLGGIVKIVAA
jgi:Holliday junction resolvase